MHHSFKNSLIFMLVTLALMISAVGVTPVFADDESPLPPATEELKDPATGGTVQPPTEVPILVQEPTTTEAPVMTEVPAATEAPIEETDSTSTLTEGKAEEISDPPFAVEEVGVGEILDAVPEDTSIIVLDDTGSLEPLTTQEAVEIIQNGDPVWCPENVIPGDPGCTAGYTSLQALLTFLAANQPAEAGVIWIESNYISSNNDAGVSSFTLSGDSVFSSMSQHDLTIQGGWSGGHNTLVNHASPSAFIGDSLAILNWGGNVTINDIWVSHTSGTGVNVNAAGSVSLDGVTAMGNAFLGANVDASESVNITNSTFNVNTYYGLAVQSGSGNVTLDEVIATANKSYRLGVNTYDGGAGALIIADGAVNVTKSVFDLNEYIGLEVDSGSSVTLNGVTARANGPEQVWVGRQDGGYGSSIDVAGDISVTNSTFNINKRDGLDIDAGGSVTLDRVTANSNGENGALINAADPVNVMNSVFNNDEDFGLEVASDGNITLNSVTASDNLFGAGVAANSYIDIMNSSFDGNLLIGLAANSTSGNIFISNSTFNGSINSTLPIEDIENFDNVVPFDTGSGAYLVTSGNVSVICSEFKRNRGYGIDAIGESGTVEGLLNLASVTFAENRLGNYDYGSSPTIMTAICNPATPTDGDDKKSRETVLYIIIKQTQDQLPAALESGNIFGSALKVLLTHHGEKISNLVITLVFPIPEDMQDAKLVVMYWDGSEWVTVPGGSVIAGYFVITVSRPGFYVLVGQ